MFDKIFLGVVEDNNDPDRQNKCRVRVLNVFEGIPTEDIPWATPWKDNNGLVSNLPDVGKVVSVEFENGDLYNPIYRYSEHYNVNLENKLKGMSDEDYLSMNAILFDEKTQIYRNESEGLKLDHEYSNINITKNGNINLNLRDNNSKMQIGTSDATQAAVLGTAFMDWMDTLVDELLGSGGGPYLGNMLSPVVPHPNLINVLLEYKASRTPKFLSNHLWLVDNNEVLSQDREHINQTGDEWKSTVEENNATIKKTEYVPEERPETGRPESKSDDVPNDNMSNVINETDVETISSGDYKNGKIPLDKMVINSHLSKDLKGDSAYLMKEASNAFNSLMSAYNSSNFEGKQKIIFTDGYRTYERQVALKKKYGSGAAKPGRSNHGWGIAVDMYWGVRTAMRKNKNKRPSAYKHPVYKWFFENAYKFGWYNPVQLRDNIRVDEWWHWEYLGKVEEPLIASQTYYGEFDEKDISNIKSVGGSFKA